MDKDRLEGLLKEADIEKLEDSMFSIAQDMLCDGYSDIEVIHYIANKTKTQLNIIKEVEDAIQNDIDDAIERKHREEPQSDEDDDSQTYEEEYGASEQDSLDQRAGDEGYAN